jgi:hypothetical protein
MPGVSTPPAKPKDAATGIGYMLFSKYVKLHVRV